MRNLIKQWKSFFRKPITQVTLFAIVLVFGLGLMMNYLLGRPATDKLVQTGLDHQLLTVRAGAISTQTYLKTVGGILESHSRHEIMREFREGAKLHLEEMMENWPDNAWTETILVDREGKVRMIVNREGNMDGLGIDVSDREFFKEAMAYEGSGFVFGRTIMPRGGVNKDKFVISVAVPLRDGEENVGVVQAAIRVDLLLGGLVEDLRLTDEARMYLLRKDGEIMFSSEEGLAGRNLYDVLKNEYRFFASEEIVKLTEERLAAGTEGSLRLLLPKYGERTKFENHLIGYYPVNLGLPSSCGCLLGIVVPERTVLVDPAVRYTRQVFVSMLAFLALIFFAIRVAKQVGYQEGREE